jgi:NAD(P)H-hydrate epimerase
MREWTGQNTAMFAVMSRQASRDFDAWAINAMGIPGVVLMENAGRGTVETMRGSLGLVAMRRATIVCGGGNNGGDGFVIARHLANLGVAVQIVLCGDPARLRGDALINHTICQKMNLPTEHLAPDVPDLHKKIQKLTAGCDVIVDALFGTGLKGELAEPFVRLISCLNAQPAPIVAVDIPSGLDCDTGDPLPVCIEAVATVTFGGLKHGFVVNPDARCATGRVFVASIGIEPNRTLYHVSILRTTVYNIHSIKLMLRKRSLS